MLITAGPTHEPIDPVRYIGNRSSGKMGYALAEAALRRGAKVILVSGPTALQPPSAAETIFVETAQQMRTAVLDRWEQASFIIMAAAVADYHVKNVSQEKIKRKSTLELQLEPNPDILADLGSLRHATGKRTPVLIGFAAETGNLLENARAKLDAKARRRHCSERCFTHGHRLRCRPQRSNHRDVHRNHPRASGQQTGHRTENSASGVAPWAAGGDSCAVARSGRLRFILEPKPCSSFSLVDSYRGNRAPAIRRSPFARAAKPR